MVFHRSRIKLNRRGTIIIDSKNIELVQTFKFLGIVLDSKRNFKNHLEYTRSEISKSMGILYETRSFLTKNALRNPYYSFVYPYLIYGSEVWGYIKKTALDPLLKVQKKIVRIISFSSYLEHTAPIFNDMKILNINLFNIA